MYSETIVSNDALAALRAAVQGQTVPVVSCGTVRDYCQTADLIPGVASFNGDIKDQQRGWILKTILANVPAGSTLLEIGAGEPLVADLLGRLGYRVIVVDPYQGAGNGPTQVAAFQEAYPNVEYIVDWFTPALDGIAPGSIDCCYSISVLEHVPLDQLPGVCEAIRKFTRPGGTTLHAIDFVLLGAGDAYHRDMLVLIGEQLGIAADAVDAMLANAATDVETYFLSAEGHNRWRGAIPYDSFPMRRCISAQIMTPVVANE